MKLQRNLLLEWIWKYPKMTGWIILFLVMWSSALTPLSYETTPERELSPIHIVDTIKIQYGDYDYIIPDPNHIGDRDNLIDVINQTYGGNYQMIVDRGRQIKLLAQLIHAEAGNQDLKGKRLVGEVILNRMRSGRFPNSMEGVIYQEGSFGVIKDGAFEKAKSQITEEDLEAARLAWEDPLDQNILYFNTEKMDCAKRWYLHGDHYFGW